MLLIPKIAFWCIGVRKYTNEIIWISASGIVIFLAIPEEGSVWIIQQITNEVIIVYLKEMECNCLYYCIIYFDRLFMHTGGGSQATRPWGVDRYCGKEMWKKHNLRTLPTSGRKTTWNFQIKIGNIISAGERILSVCSLRINDPTHWKHRAV